jgi:hypothetical protein
MILPKALVEDRSKGKKVIMSNMDTVARGWDTHKLFIYIYIKQDCSRLEVGILTNCLYIYIYKQENWLLFK